MRRKKHKLRLILGTFAHFKDKAQVVVLLKLVSFIFLFLLSSEQLCYAQTDSVFTGQKQPKKTVKEKQLSNEIWKKAFTYGGNFQAWFGNPTFISLSPTIGYNVFKNFNAGLGFTFNYTSKNFGQYGKISSTIFGPHVYMRYVFSSYFMQLQYDKLLQPNVLSSYPNEKTWVDYLLIGGGFRQPLGNGVYFNSSIMYNLISDILSIYPSRVIVQFGITGIF